MRSTVEVSGPAYWVHDDRQDPTCWLKGTIDAGIVFGSSFQEFESPQSEPRLTLADNGTGTIIGGLAIDGKEWEFGGPGSVAKFYSLVPFYFWDEGPPGYPGFSVDPSQPEWGDPTLEDFVLFLFATWSGTASENFSGDKAPVEVNVNCTFVPTWVLEVGGTDVAIEIFTNMPIPAPPEASSQD